MNSTKVKVKNLDISARKLRLVVDMVRGMEAKDAIDVLNFTNKKAALFVRKAIESGIANAEHNHGWKSGSLVVQSISVDEGSTRKSMRFASRGRSARILKRSSHLNLELSRK